jgi:hypothetical protein
MKESGNLYLLPFLFFHSSLQDHPKYQENHRKKGSHLVLQGIDYKKTNVTNNGLFYSQLKMLVMQQSKTDAVKVLIVEKERPKVSFILLIVSIISASIIFTSFYNISSSDNLWFSGLDK